MEKLIKKINLEINYSLILAKNHNLGLSFGLDFKK